MDVVREVLDKQLVDRHHRPMGRADGIVVEIRNGQAPRVMYLETGPATTARRKGRQLSVKRPDSSVSTCADFD
jgi:hypothetical protein